MRLNISAKIVILSSFVLGITLLGHILASNLVLSSEFNRAHSSKSLAIGQELEGQLNRLLNLNIPLESLSGFEKQCKDVVDRYEGVSYAFVADLQGRIIFHSNPDKHGLEIEGLKATGAGDFENRPQIRSVGAFIEAVLPILHGSVDYVGTIHIGFPDTIVTDRLNEVTTYTLLIGITFILLSVIISFLLLKPLVTRPLGRLIEVMTEMQKNGSDTELGHLVSRTDEIGKLGRSFGDLMTQLNASRTEVETYADHLEEVVAKRTTELRISNRDLKEEIGERKKAMQLYRELFEEAPVMYVITRAEPEGPVIVNCNILFLLTLGYQRNAIIGKPLANFYSAESKKEMLATGYNEALKGTFKAQERQLITRDGDTIDTLLQAVPQADASGIVKGTRAMFLDITDRKRTESEKQELLVRLRRAEKMESLGVMAGGVAHDLNNMLSGIVSYPELLLMQIPADSPLVEPLNTIHRSGQRATAIVQDLLSLSRRGMIPDEVVNLNAIVSEFLESPELEKIRSFHPKVTIKNSLANDLLNVKGGAVHLAKVAMNLIVNAAEAMPDGGTIFIETRNQYFDQATLAYDQIEEGEYIIMEVADEGFGISEEDQEKIFEPFYSKKKLGRSGTGLGMSVIWGTVKDHNGYIDLKSEMGKGTSISIILPASRETIEGRTDGPDIDVYKGNGEQVLVVDDLEDQRVIASQIIESLGYEVASCSSGWEALTYLKSKKADLVILDMIMQDDMDGLDTFIEIRKLNPLQKAIIASGFSETHRVHKMQELGAGEYLRKPYTIAQLGRAVSAAINGTQ